MHKLHSAVRELPLDVHRSHTPDFKQMVMAGSIFTEANVQTGPKEIQALVSLCS